MTELTNEDCKCYSDFQCVVRQTDLIETIKQFVALEKHSKLVRGDTLYGGSCPFCPEEEFFYANVDKEIFRCPRCDAYGDVISFIARKKNITQIEAMKWLLEKGPKKKKCAFPRKG